MRLKKLILPILICFATSSMHAVSWWQKLYGIVAMALIAASPEESAAASACRPFHGEENVCILYTLTKENSGIREPDDIEKTSLYYSYDASGIPHLQRRYPVKCNAAEKEPLQCCRSKTIYSSKGFFTVTVIKKLCAFIEDNPAKFGKDATTNHLTAALFDSEQQDVKNYLNDNFE